MDISKMSAYCFVDRSSYTETYRFCTARGDILFSRKILGDRFLEFNFKRALKRLEKIKEHGKSFDIASIDVSLTTNDSDILKSYV